MTTSTAGGQQHLGGGGTGWRRWAGPLLLVSLMANLLVIGAVAGAFLKSSDRHGHHGKVPHVERGLIGYVGSLPQPRRDALLAEFETSREQVDAERAKARAARHAVLETLAAEPFDRAALAAAVDKAVSAEAAFRARTSTVFVSIASQLTPEERRAFRDWREEHHKSFRGGHHD